VQQKTAAIGCLTAALMLAVPVQAQERTITCQSFNYRYAYCRVNTDNRVTLTRQISGTRCRLWDNWGYDNRGIWVDRGCAATFRTGRYGSDNTGAAVAGAVVAGVALAAVIAAAKDHHSDTVPSWAVGTFKGYDDVEQTDVEVTIQPGGSVTGWAAGESFTGRWTGDRLEAGRKRFRVERSGNGFMATDDSGRGNRVYFRRADSRY
jgi:hypothetical protein